VIAQPRPCKLYRHFNARGELLYVGISLDAIARSAAHARSARWWDEVAQIRIASYPSQEAAAEAEWVAICVESPRYNLRRRRQAVSTMRGTRRRAPTALTGPVEVDPCAAIFPIRRAAAILGCETSLLLGMCSRGELGTKLFGRGHWMVRRFELEHLLGADALRVLGPAAPLVEDLQQEARASAEARAKRVLG